ncbi:hypothetical protein P9112_005164 [Eukaryota sp. TZLM1-RC]
MSDGPLHLDCSGLTDMESILPQLSVFTDLTYLHLYQNKFHCLPKDLSCLSELETLDLSNNKFSAVEDVIDGLLSLPKLKHLFIHFENPKDEEEIALRMDTLSSLNGISLDDVADHVSSRQQLPAIEVPSTPCDVLLQSSYILDELDSNIGDLFEEFLTLSDPSQDKSIDDVINVNQSLITFSNALAQKVGEDSENEKVLRSIISLLVNQLSGNSEILETRGNDTSASRDESSKVKLMEDIGFLQSENERLLARIKKLELQHSPRVSTPTSRHMTSPGQKTAQKTPKSQEKSVEKTGNSKYLTLKQLKELIEEIYVSKQKFDQKCEEINQPKETMSQHLLSFLTHRYGLKSLILQWSRAVKVAVEKFKNVDNDVMVFDRMLKNLIDEDFRLVQSQLKSTVYELVKAAIRSRHPLISESELGQKMSKKVKSVLTEPEWVEVVTHMYSNEDSLTIIRKLKDQGSNSMTFNDLLKFLLDYQLEAHQDFLSSFKSVFDSLDDDNDGILTLNQFKNLLKKVDNREEVEEKCLNSLSCNRVTFSEAVGLLSESLLEL